MAYYSPTLTTLWEAGMCSMKYHLKRLVGFTIYTFEELSIPITQV